MKYYKQNNEVFAYDDEQIALGLSNDKVLMTDEEVEAHINPPKTEAQILAEQVQEAKTYLASTDFKMTVDYYATLTEVEQQELTTKRAEARAFLKESGL